MGLAKVDSGVGEQKVKPKPTVNVVIGMFFDGTINNRTNTTDRIKGYKSYIKKEDSYENDYSNVGRLSNYYQTKNEDLLKQLMIYVEGIGTTDHASDSSHITDHAGGAFGAGVTGIRGKVKSGCKRIAAETKRIADGKVVQTLTFDVFGFSRGSAAARNFINEVTRFEEYQYAPKRGDSFPDTETFISPKDGKAARGFLGYYLKQEGVQVNLIKIRFVGLYDTVSSYSPQTAFMSDFDDDVRELHLDAVRRASRVVHLTAADEHRKNFALTNISSTGARTIVPVVPGEINTIHTGAGARSIQLSLPGVHSDIGGCYRDGITEVVNNLLDKNQVAQEAEMKRLIHEGWYTKKQLMINVLECLRGARPLSNQYSFITLHMMCDFAVQYKANLFNKIQIERNYKIAASAGNVKSLLQYIKDRLYHYAFVDNSKPLVFNDYPSIHAQHKNAQTAQEKARYQDALADQANLLLLRNNFLHWSADCDTLGMSPNIEHGKRVRHVYDDVIDKKNKHWYVGYTQ